MKYFFALLLLLMVVAGYAQQYKYTYYFDQELRPVAKIDAFIVGRGAKTSGSVTVDFFDTKTGKKILTTEYSDSILSAIDGRNTQYHSNGKVAKNSYYKANILHGKSQQWDSVGRLVDSTMFYEDMPVYTIMYAYSTNGNRNIIHEFDNTYAKKKPREKDVVITIDGNILPASVWQNLLYSGRYGWKQDKITPNTYLVYKFSDSYFDKIVANDPKPKESDFFKMGQNFVIDERDINNNKLKSKDLLGKVLVINYWFINCKPCRMEMPDLNKLVAEYKDSLNVKFIAIGLDDKSSIKDFLKQSRFDYQVVADGRNATEKYKVTAFPTHVIVDKAGKVYFHTVSSPRQLMYWMKKTINELLQQP